MSQKNQEKGTIRVETRSTGKKIGHWTRVAVMFMSGGFVFPHAMTEDDDAKRDADGNATKTP